MTATSKTLGKVPDPHESQPHAQLSADIAVLLVSMAICVPCVITRTGAPSETVETILREFERTTTVTLMSGPCESCGREALLYRVE